MKCPECGHDDTRVLESRLANEGRSVRRRRTCPECNYRFTTYEREEEFVFQIRKRDGRIEAFNKEKAIKSLRVACQKRPVTLDQLEGLLSRIERTIQDGGERVIASQALGEMILNGLKEIDKVAYVRFASVYKDFKDTDEFLRELVAIDRLRPVTSDVTTERPSGSAESLASNQPN